MPYDVKQVFKKLCEVKYRKAKMYAAIRIEKIMQEIDDAVALGNDSLLTYILDPDFADAIKNKSFDVYACEVEIIHQLKIDLGFKVEVDVKHSVDTIRISWGEDVVGKSASDNIRSVVRPFSDNEPEELNGITLTGQAPE